MLDPAQNINPGARQDFLTIENVDTFLTADGEVLRNMHPPCLVWIFDAWKARQEGAGGQFDTHLICIFYRERERDREWERVEPWFFVTFNIITSHIFEHFIEFRQVIQKIWKFHPSVLTTFINFLDFFTFLCHRER